jgi:hypothetical protein
LSLKNLRIESEKRFFTICNHFFLFLKSIHHFRKSFKTSTNQIGKVFVHNMKFFYFHQKHSSFSLKFYRDADFRNRLLEIAKTPFSAAFPMFHVNFLMFVSNARKATTCEGIKVKYKLESQQKTLSRDNFVMG